MTEEKDERSLQPGPAEDVPPELSAEVLAAQLLGPEKSRLETKRRRPGLTAGHVFALIAFALAGFMVVFSMGNRAESALVDQLRKDQIRIGRNLGEDVSKEQVERLVAIWEEMAQEVVDGRPDYQRIADGRRMLQQALPSAVDELDSAEIERILEELGR